MNNKIRWNIFYLYNFFKKRKRLDKEICSLKIENPIIFAPHADDEWIGCSKILSTSKNATVIYFSFLGNNYSTENKLIRVNELKKLKETLNFNLLIIGENLSYSDLYNLLKDQNFSSLFIPFPIDWHVEHIKVNKILIDILKTIDKQFSLYFYQVTVPIPEIIKKEYISLTKRDILFKKYIFKETYKSQQNIPIIRITIQNKVYGTYYGIYAAELYAKLSLKDWDELITKILNNFKKLELLKNSIDNLGKIEKLVNREYLKF